jgi:DNA-binding response OmpR family regulator
MKIVVVEDDPRVSDFLARGLRAEGYRVECATTGTEGLALIKECKPDVAILDVRLPGLNGLDVCQQLRAAGFRTPVLMLTALGTVEDRVVGLRMGADDYMVKPFAFEELLARIAVQIRRSEKAPGKPDVVNAGEIEFDREALEVSVRGRRVDLTAKELALLDLLLSRPGKVFSRARILSAVWGVSADPLTNVVDVYIRRLRAKLDAEGVPSVILTVRGYGYKVRVHGNDEKTP